MDGFVRGGVAIHSRSEDESPAIFVCREVPFGFEDAHERENGAVSILAFQSLDDLRNGRRASGPNDLHDAEFGVGESRGFLAGHGNWIFLLTN